VVYCGGLENRCGLTPTGGSNPSLSAIINCETDKSDLWWKGHIQRFSAYWRMTMEELRKCTWPTWDELKGSTVVVMVSIILLGLFTFVVDQILFALFKII
jgi:preprotein translocase subunit SecE